MDRLYAKHVFDREKMFRYLTRETYDALVAVIQEGSPLDRSIADSVAEGMRRWATEMGVTHYTHWFQPLTGGTAEKHESFLEYDRKGGVMEEFSGKVLIQQEPDASSFPNGGIRNTFEARGYTAWDASSPVFIIDDTLCIPTIFISYTGEALDAKTPLLRSVEAVSREGIRLLRLFGNTTAKKINAYVGPEQEYFLVDRKLLEQRKDLIYTGRTLFGASAPKGQELDDHYFGKIRARVGSFMHDVNIALWKYGITASTQHNEVAPAQHELAPIFSTANVAVDQNNLTMETMKRIAYEHGMSCLLHEKPYKGVNGSGKHNNWSLGTDDGENLFRPGKHPEDNLQFQLMLACVMQAVDRHADLLREAAADVGNDHRLGAQEAPPAIISIFVGDHLASLIRKIIGKEFEDVTVSKLDTGVSTVPLLQKDTSDRNRTSPFAFTGNRFEFRMVGSSDNIAECNTVLNAIMAEAFCDAADALENAENFEEACKAYIKEVMTKHQRIVFNGDGYSDEWIAEAARRGLPNIPCMVEAIPVLTQPDVIDLFQKFNIFTAAELECRKEVSFETYSHKMAIEARTMIHMAGKQYIPAIIRYAAFLGESISSVEAGGGDASVPRKQLRKITNLLNHATEALETLEVVFAQADNHPTAQETARYYRYSVVPAMENLRAPIDELEMIVSSDFWPVPSYGDLMYDV